MTSFVKDALASSAILGEGGTLVKIGFGAILSMGFELAISTLGGLYIGSLIDRRRGGGIFAPVGLIVGLLVGFHRAYMLVRSAMRKPE